MGACAFGWGHQTGVEQLNPQYHPNLFLKARIHSTSVCPLHVLGSKGHLVSTTEQDRVLPRLLEIVAAKLSLSTFESLRERKRKSQKTCSSDDGKDASSTSERYTCHAACREEAASLTSPFGGLNLPVVR